MNMPLGGCATWDGQQMCGFVGFVDIKRRHGNPELASLATEMAACIAHRGPDDGQLWSDETNGIAMAFRRLAIVDLTEQGRQPMTSHSGRLVLCFNGEIYNAPELRPELKAAGVLFHGHSDTEVLLEALDLWGVQRTLERISGMFAFACWDREALSLLLARDHIGKKPVYYGRSGGIFFFGSQPKAFRPHPAWSPQIDRDSLCAFLRFGYVPSPLSIFQGVRKLRPGECVTVVDGRVTKTERFWDLQAIAGAARRSRTSPTDAEAISQLDELLGDAVERRLLSDVPLGAFLSGGVDSSTVVALMQARRPGSVRTFSIGFSEAEFDESDHARSIAEHLGTDHHEMRVTPEGVRAAIPVMPEYFDEPFADASQVPTYLLSALTRRHVTVALSGDGGDELFGGYTRYRHARDILSFVDKLPKAMQPAMAASLRAVPVPVWQALHPLVPRRFGKAPLASRMHRVADMLSEDGLERIYRDLIGQWPDPDALVVDGHEPVDALWHGSTARNVPDFSRRMQLIDSLTYLPDDILVKVDRASMACSLEARAPILDRQVVEFSWSLPNDMMVRHGQSKWILKQVLKKYVPDHLIDRPKMGFMFPIAQWLRGPLKEWASDLLAPPRLDADGLFRASEITRLWHQHLSGRHDWGHQLWCILMFQAWKNQWQ